MRFSTPGQRLFAGSVTVALAVLASCPDAFAQTIQTDNTAVLRFAPGSDASVTARPMNLNPTGISFTDCADDLDLQFTLDFADGVPSDSEVQVWVGPGDCVTNAAARSPGQTSYGRCWQAAPSSAFSASGLSSTGRIHVRDIVQFMGVDDPPATYTPATSAAACKPATSASVVPLNIVFMFVEASALPKDGGAAAAYVGTPGQYTLSAALIGPFAPQAVGIPEGGINSGTLDVSWVPQVEATIQGYNIYYQDITESGTAKVDASSVLEAPILCRERLPCTTESDAATDGGKDAGCDAGESDAFTTPADSASLSGLSDAALTALGCKRGASVFAFDAASTGTGGSTCQSLILTNTFTVDGGLGTSVTSSGEPSATVPEAGSDDAGFDSGTESGTVVVTTTTTTGMTYQETAGISNIPTRYRYTYVAGATTSSFQLTGLTNNHVYAIAVAAVDGSGNVGPVGDLTCAAPEPVTDFFTAYNAAGGQAGGGFCAVVAAGAPAFGSLFGFGIAGFAIALSRRRRRMP